MQEKIKLIRERINKRLQHQIKAKNTFHDTLRQFWNFLESNIFIKSIFDELEHHLELTCNDSFKVLAESSLRKKKPLAHILTEKNNACFCYLIIKYCVNTSSGSIESEFGRGFGHSNSHPYDVFVNEILAPLCSYIDESLENREIMLGLLNRFKYKSEWFCRKKLFDIWVNASRPKEVALQKEVYQFLYDQGVDFYLEPNSASGQIDLISQQNIYNEPLLIDVKIFHDSTKITYLKKAFKQAYTYCNDFNEDVFYLVIFKTTEKDLSVEFSNNSSIFPYLIYNNKKIFVVVIDIANHSTSASQRRPINPMRLQESKVIEFVNEK